MPVPVPDRRKVPRSASAGRVEIVLVDPAPGRVEAELIEISSMGFRAAHDSRVLEPGLEVLCKRDRAEAVRARVIWTHVLGGHRVSGFLLLVPEKSVRS
jgi:hypothetical protein